MQLEVGNVLEGKVTGITKFGAFVELTGGKTGMVHISEVSSTYVKEISDYLKEGQVVKVKILGITEEGKISLSIKKCQELQDAPAPQPPRRAFAPRQENRGWQPKKPIPQENMTFEDMMTKFKQTSEDKMSDLKRGNEVRRYSRRGQKS
jgi:S1 RNA binding domain protein